MSELESAVSRALEIIGGTAEGYAKQLCPVGTPESTGIKGYVGGTLRNSITHQMEGKNAVIIASNVHYAPFVELGTVKMRAQPYMRPAVEGHKPEYEAIARKELKK